MFDIGMSEMLVIAVVAIIVVGPKDLPKMLRNIGKTVTGMKRMANDFQRQLTDVVDDADFASVKDLATGKGLDPVEQFKDIAKHVQKDLYDDDDAIVQADANGAKKEAAKKPQAKKAATKSAAKAKSKSVTKTASNAAPKAATKTASKNKIKPATKAKVASKSKST